MMRDRIGIEMMITGVVQKNQLNDVPCFLQRGPSVIVIRPGRTADFHKNRIFFRFTVNIDNDLWR